MTATISGVLDSACHYERYNTETLLPENDSTYVRLIETGWTQETFKGKTVLDIGCNAGTLSIFAHQLGAKAVHAVDVTTPFVEFFSDVVDRHNLPIKVDCASFNDLSVEKHASDVVLCMQVLHWIVHQNGNLTEAVAHLAALTNETLYVETPWDIHEPSIANRDGYPVENYDIEIIIRALSRHFEEVRIDRFMTYFGRMKNSKRVLISATGKRKASLPIRHMRDVNYSGISLSRGINPTMLVTSTEGIKVLKTVPNISAFVRLDDSAMYVLCDFLINGDSNSPIVAPEHLGESYRQVEADGHTYMLYPFLGDLGQYFPAKKIPSGANDPMELALGVFRHFSKVPAEVLEPLKMLFSPLPSFDFRNLPHKNANAINQHGLTDFLTNIAAKLAGYDRTQEDGLLHNDMQMGNMIRTPRGHDRVVDLDLLRPGPAYADIFSCTIYNGENEEHLEKCLAKAQKEAAREPNMFDLTFAVGGSLLWLNARLKRDEKLGDSAFKRYVNGLKTVERFCETLVL